MEVLTDEEIRAFLVLDSGNGSGDCDGRGHVSGNGDGHGNGYGFGDGDGFGDGGGDGYGDGDCDGDGYGGNGFGDGGGYGFGCGGGYGNGRGAGNGGSGKGLGFGEGYRTFGIESINGYKVYNVDEVPTIITFIRGNIAKGYILEHNVNLMPCYIVKENSLFAHGSTLREAFSALQEKLYDNSTEEERIKAFKQKFPLYDTKYDNKDLFTYHHVLTGSCKMGRETFVKNNRLSLDGKTTVREFVEITKNDYGGNIIKKLPEAYGVTD